MSQDDREHAESLAESPEAARSSVSHPDYDTRAAAVAADEYVEFLVDRGAELIVCAPHGGRIEYRTDEQAARVAAALGATEWSCAGYRSGGGAYDRWHVTSTAIEPGTFPKLASIANRGFDHAVSFHGFSEDGVAVGGRAPRAFKARFRDAIDAATDGHYDASIADDGPYAGTSPENFVNWLTERDTGIQIEQSRDARTDDWALIADAVADVYADVL